MTTKGRPRGWKATPEYVAWAHMKARCYNPKNKDYENYGGRGIAVCDRWHDFDLFFLDMGEKPSANHTLEREDCDGNYEPGNVVWLIRELQSRNRRCVRKVEVEGQLISLPEAAELHGISLETVDCRMRRGWSAQKALSEPVGFNPKNAKLFNFFGEQLSLNAIAKRTGKPSANLYYFVNQRGMSLEEALAQ